MEIMDLVLPMFEATNWERGIEIPGIRKAKAVKDELRYLNLL